MMPKAGFKLRSLALAGLLAASAAAWPQQEEILRPEAAFPYPLPHAITHAARKGPRQLLGGGLKGPIRFGFIALDYLHR